MSQFNKLKISNIIHETEKAVSITFEVPQELQDKYKFIAGQYITLRTLLDGEEVRRDYSLCTNPNTGLLKVVVKKVKDGAFSVFANTILAIGDTLDVALPNGRFIFEPKPSSKRTIVAFAAGSGITPIMSIARTILEEESSSSFVLTYGNRTPEDTIFLNELNTLNSDYGDRFSLKHMFSQSNEDNALFGRIEKSAVNYTLNQIKDKHSIEAFYLCGPEAMIKTVSSVLVENGFDERIIHFELFTPTIDSNESIAVGDGKTKVTVLVDDEECYFLMPQTKTILESALENDVDAPYSCQGGICSSCIARLTSGNVEMRQNNILTDSEVADGLILTCQAQPTTSEVSVDYDDV